MSKEELSAIEEKLNSKEYYGFLNQGFDSPESVDWEEVFFDGAGISTSDVSDAEKDALLKELQWDELYGDTFAISKSDMDNYIKEPQGSILPLKRREYSNRGLFVSSLWLGL